MKVIAKFGEDYAHNVVAWTELRDDEKYNGQAKRDAAKSWKEMLDAAFEKFGPGENKPKAWFEISLQVRRALKKWVGKESYEIWVDYKHKKGCPEKVTAVAMATIEEITEKGVMVK